MSSLHPSRVPLQHHDTDSAGRRASDALVRCGVMMIVRRQLPVHHSILGINMVYNQRFQQGLSCMLTRFWRLFLITVVICYQFISIYSRHSELAYVTSIYSDLKDRHYTCDQAALVQKRLKLCIRCTRMFCLTACIRTTDSEGPGTCTAALACRAVLCFAW